jgi:alkanesulfonate monooxygenase SsuD/methylene tetrahydromethanopterin reductase-like flavin-dependent oxidoreductase (luciferase family)
MEIGIQFFPDIGPETTPADVYWDECLRLVDQVDELGYTHVRTVEHYFESYGGYSPNPHVFLCAASQRTRKARLVTGAVLPVFNHPLKIAGEIGMLDAISGGRLECGFARAFLPHEFERFGIDIDESKARFQEGIDQVRDLLENENVSSDGQFHSYDTLTSLPRPTQKPRPPFWVAAIATPASFENAGKMGDSVMAIPMAGAKMRELIGIYRDAWKSAGHEGTGRVMLAFHMYCAATEQEAVATARDPLNRYLKSLVDSASDWTSGATSKDYPGYDKIIEGLSKETMDTQRAKNAAWIGSPESICDQISTILADAGTFEIASLQVNFNTITYDQAAASMRLFSEQVMPKFTGAARAA